MKKLLTLLLLALTVMTASAQRTTDKLDRGLIGIKVNAGVFLSWRIQADEYYDVKYNLYRDGNKIAENQYDDFDEFLADVDMVVIMVKHDHIKQNWDKLKGKVILDCFNICPLEGVYHI